MCQLVCCILPKLTVPLPAPNPPMGKGLATVEQFLSCISVWLHANIMQLITCLSYIATKVSLASAKPRQLT